jgi:hypothetical protein
LTTDSAGRHEAPGQPDAHGSATPGSAPRAALETAPAAAGRRRRGIGSLELLTVGLLVLLLAQRWLVGLFDSPAVQTWATIFVSINVQALPFLVFGVVLSAIIAAFVPPSVFTKLLPSRPVLAVPVAGASGMVLPGCECASVPVAGSLVARGVTPAAAFAFLLAAPAINPVVLASTAVAFPGRPEVVGARFLASITTSVVMGWLWVRFGKTEWLHTRRPHTEGLSKWGVFRAAAQHDFLHAGGFLVVGGLTAATLNVVVPRDIIQSVADSGWLSVIALALLAVVLAICSEADAFVAASLTEFSLTARLAFMVVGPTVDVKLIAMQAGVFGRSFAMRFAPLTLVTAVMTSVFIGWWLL